MGAGSVPTDAEGWFELFQFNFKYTTCFCKAFRYFFLPLKMPIAYNNIVTGNLPPSSRHGKDDKTQSAELSEAKNN